MRLVLLFIKVLKMSRFFMKTKIKTKTTFLSSRTEKSRNQDPKSRDYISAN